MADEKTAQVLNASQQNLFKVAIQPRRTDGEDAEFSVAPIVFRTKKVPIPGITLPAVPIPNRVAPFTLPAGGKPIHPTEVEILLELDDELSNYLSLVRWIDSIANLAQTKGERDLSYLKDIDKGNEKGEDLVSGVSFGGRKVAPKRTIAEMHVNQGRDEWVPLDYRDIVIEMLNSDNVLFGYLAFREAWPVSVPDFDFTTTSSDRIEIGAKFSYAYHEFLDKDGVKIV